MSLTFIAVSSYDWRCCSSTDNYKIKELNKSRTSIYIFLIYFGSIITVNLKWFMKSLVVFLQVFKMKNQYYFIHAEDNHYEVM